MNDESGWLRIRYACITSRSRHLNIFSQELGTTECNGKDCPGVERSRALRDHRKLRMNICDLFAAFPMCDMELLLLLKGFLNDHAVRLCREVALHHHAAYTCWMAGWNGKSSLGISRRSLPARQYTPAIILFGNADNPGRKGVDETDLVVRPVGYSSDIDLVAGVWWKR